MSYKHGVYVSEVPTSVLAPVQADAGIPFIVGTAPVGMADPSNVNKPVLCYTYAEAVAAFGYVPPQLNAVTGLKEYAYTLSEAIYSQFALFGVAPCVIVNVLDPAEHSAAATTTEITVGSDHAAIVAETGILPATVEISSTTEEGGESTTTTYIRGTHYELSFDEDGQLVVSSLYGDSGEPMLPTGDLDFSASKTDPTAVAAEDVIGGVALDGSKSGLELVSDVFPKFRLVPGTVIAPGFSGQPAVAAVMAAKCQGINGVYNAVSVIDIPTAGTGAPSVYSQVPAWKENNNINDPFQIACWPLLSLDGTVFHASTQLAGLMQQVDADNGDVPYVSPSNKNFQMTAAVLADGTEIWMDNQQAAYLNGNGIVTAENFIGGWKCWGNRTSCYPGNTDVKDDFIPVRRMFNWIGNTLVQTFWQRVDYPLNRRQIDTIVDTANIWLNGLTAREYILGGRVEFLESENPETALLDGIATLHVYVTPCSPNREIDFTLEYDTNYLATLFATEE